MKPLLTLISVFIVALLVSWASGRSNIILAGNIAMSAMLVFTAIGHLVFAKGMVMMIPAFIPFKKQLVLLTGIFELLAAIGLLFTPYRLFTSIALVCFFILVLPANTYAATHKVNYQKANYEGSGTGYLWSRIPMQVLFIAWVFYSGIHSGH